MSHTFSEADLESYLDEELDPAVMAEIETMLREDKSLARQLIAIISRRDAGVHSIGGVWRRHRASCPSREQLGSFLLGAMTKEPREYVTFHLEVVGCRFCQASLEDLRARQQEAGEEVATRRARYFQTSAGYLKKK